MFELHNTDIKYSPGYKWVLAIGEVETAATAAVAIYSPGMLLAQCPGHLCKAYWYVIVKCAI